MLMCGMWLYQKTKEWQLSVNIATTGRECGGGSVGVLTVVLAYGY
jgi:hypothetical protein